MGLKAFKIFGLESIRENSKLTLKLPGGPNGPSFKNIGYGSYMKKKNVVFGMYVISVYKFLDAQ